MKYFIGIAIAFVGFFLASQHLNQTIQEYWDFVAFFVVILGTGAVMLMTSPAVPKGILISKFSQKFYNSGKSLKAHGEACLKVYSSRGTENLGKSIEDQLLKDGLELQSLGFNGDKVQEIVSQSFQTYATKVILISSWLRRCAKYPPAFGLAGTVLGLIHLMRGISTGIDPKETGLRMAVALVATFYGLLISNLFLNPVGEWLSEELKKDEIKSEMSLLTVSLIEEGVDYLEIQEKINSYLMGSERLKMDMSLVSEAA